MVKQKVVEMLFGESGLQMNIIRYNIGGGSNPDTDDRSKLRSGGDVPGYKSHKDAAYDWESDKGQLYFVQNYNKDIIIEAFSNSAPWFMTKNGLVSGNRKMFTTNLKWQYRDDFVTYLVDVMEHLKKEKKINIEYISPMNEPSSPLFPENQEGCYWDPITRRSIIKKLRDTIKNRNLDIKIACCDENNVLQALTAMTVFCDKVNIHTYRLKQFMQFKTYDIEDAFIFRRILGFVTKYITRKSLWVSEWGSGTIVSYKDIKNGIHVGLKIINDIVNLKVTGWVYWQAVENGSGDGGWGLMQVPFKPDAKVEEITTSNQYIIFSHFSKFIKRNDEIINGYYNENGVSYVHATNGKEKIVVIINNTDSRQAITFDSKRAMKVYITNNDKNMEEVELETDVFVMGEYEIRTIVTVI